MRGFVRSAVPKILVEKGAKWTLQWIDLRENNANANFPWYSSDKKSAREWLLPQLRAMTAGHCSFCDAFPLEGQANEPIEHFRPKSKFLSLAYEWGNLYYCCEKCQSSKGEQWSDDLLAPDVAGYCWSDWFEFDYTTGHVRPNAFADAHSQNRTNVTIRLYGLGSRERARRRILELKKWTSTDSQARSINDFSDRDYLERNNPEKSSVA